MRAVVLLIVVGACRWAFDDQPRGDGSIVDGVAGDGASDGASDGSTSGDAANACAGFDVCDGFEAATLDPSTWTADPGITIDTTHAHRGTRSVHVHTNAFSANTSSYTNMWESKTIMTSTTFWVRGWFWLSALPASGNGLELITAERPGNNGDYVFVFSNATHIYAQYGSGSSDITMTAVPVGSWFCVVWKVVRSTTTTGSLELTSDTLPQLSLPNVQTDSATLPMTILVFGMGFADSNTPSAQPAIDLWIDDIIAHDAPVTCAD